MRRMLKLLGLAMLQAGLAGAQTTKRPLDHDVYNSWHRIQDQQLADDGRWILYALVPQEGDAVLHVRSIAAETSYAAPRGRGARFSDDGRFVVFLIKPELALQREAKQQKKKPDEQPKDSLGILDLTTGEIASVERVKSFALPEEAGGWVAYLLEKELEEAEPDTAQAEEEPQPAEPVEPQEPGAEQEEDEKKEKKEGTTLVLRNLASSEEWRFAKVTEYAFSKNGAHLAYTVSSEDGEADGAFVVNVTEGTVDTLLGGEGAYRSVTFDEASRQLAFLSNRDDYQADQPAFTLYYWRVGSDGSRALASEGAAGIPEGWWVSEHGDLSFSDDGRRLFFGTAPRPEPEPEDEIPEWEKVDLDIWHWKDPLLQPMQLVQRDDDLKRSYTAVVHLRNGRIVQLADQEVPGVTVGSEGDADVALGNTNVPYRQRISWDSPRYHDVYVMDVRDGSRRLVLEELQGRASLSPEARYLTWWDGSQRAWFALPVDGGDPVNLSADIPYPVYNELHDWPMLHGSYGSAGWTEGDRAFLVYDRHDMWALDPTGRRAARNLTEGVGREQNLRYRYVRLDPDQEAVPEDEPLLLHTFDLTTKAGGFSRDAVRGDTSPERLLMEDRYFSQFAIRRADDADVLMFTRQSFREFPDLWVSGPAFRDMKRMSEANPQMAEYRWGTAELVHWRSSDGTPLTGLLYKPEDFDPSRQYPMMVYFYEKMSDGLHQFRSPGPGGSSISVSFYASRDYVVFVPDVHYRVGYPGESALDCVVTGVLSVLDRGFVDPARIGVQGHSWGGYQIAYLITQTNIFRAAEAGAPVSNMTSAYGGIRWGSGMSRMFQYERTQSRIGGSLWERPMRYLENSPLFWADKIHTPVLMMHNDEDTAVPWYQGIEFFVALRRLGKPAWLLNYNGEPHGLRKYQNRVDWMVRMQQFFDHYLKDAPAPVWMAEGVPAVSKGTTLGLQLVEEQPAAGSGGGRQP